MQKAEFIEAVKRICQTDTRYDREAYTFVREALDFTVKMYKKQSQQPGIHVTGQELLEGIRSFALQEFGPAALTVLTAWGIRSTSDFGEIVFSLVSSGVLGKTEQDRKEDFAKGYDFHEAFARPFLPQSQRRNRKRATEPNLPKIRKKPSAKRDSDIR